MAQTSSSKQLKFSSWSSSAEEIAGNIDFLIQILLRLPARSVIRFKSVSKQWRYLILGTRFPPKYISHNPKPPISGLYYLWDTYPIPLQGHSLPSLTFLGTPEASAATIGRVEFKIHASLSSLTFLGTPEASAATIGTVEFKIYASRHGLLVCSHYPFSGPPQILVCNPTTQKYRDFHQRFLGKEIRSYDFYLYFDPSISPIYKLVLIRVNGPNYEICTCASNRSFWKTISFEAQELWGHCLRHGVLSSDGIIYMITENWYLVQYDVQTEKLSATSMSVTQEPDMLRNKMIGYFGECADGNLVLIVAKKRGPDFMVYEMNTRLEGRNWVLKYHINATEVLPNLPKMPYPINRSNFAVMRVFYDGEGNEKDLTLVLGIPEKAIVYHHRSKEAKVICDLPGRDYMHWETTYRNVSPFVGSLCAI